MSEQLINRIGEISIATNGQKMTIKAYRSCFDIDVEFEDGYIAMHKLYKDFKKGHIRNPKYRIGETSISSEGQKMTIIKFKRSDSISIQFEDGTVIKNVQYSAFKKGRVKNPNYSPRIGETSIATNGQKMTIIGYIRNDNITVQFEDRTVVKHKDYYSFRDGYIKNPNFILGKTIINGWLIVKKAYKNKDGMYEYIVYNKERNETDIKNIRELYNL